MGSTILVNQYQLYYNLILPKQLIGNPVKHLLIFLSIFLLSSPLLSQTSSKVILYKWETSDGFKWKKFGNKGIHEKYAGEVRLGNIPNGLGTIYYLNREKYFGEVRDGLRDGLGTYTWYFHETRIKYVGEFTNDEFGKIGKIFYLTGQKYEGEVFNDLFHGKGVKTLSDGGKYIGVWKRNPDDEINIWKMTGFDKNGIKILEISEGKGNGLYVFVSGDMYEGKWKEGKPTQGTVKYLYGDKYVGGLKDGKHHGHGTLTYSNGDKYIGEWKDGKHHGHGTLTYSNDDKYIGEWKDGKLWNTTLYYKDGNIIGKTVNGVKQ